MTAAIAWATGLPGLFITVPGLMWLGWGVRNEWRRRQRARDVRERRIARALDHRDPPLYIVRDTPGGLGDRERGAS